MILSNQLTSLGLPFLGEAGEFEPHLHTLTKGKLNSNCWKETSTSLLLVGLPSQIHTQTMAWWFFLAAPPTTLDPAVSRPSCLASLATRLRDA